MLRNFTYLLFISLFLFACKKEVSNNPAEQIQADLQRVIDAADVEQIYVYDNPNIGVNTDASSYWTFSNGFIWFGSQTDPDARNLAYLYRYDVAKATNGSTQVTTLLLYFK